MYAGEPLIEIGGRLPSVLGCEICAKVKMSSLRAIVKNRLISEGNYGPTVSVRGRGRADNLDR
jgi:hypothetical protein